MSERKARANALRKFAEIALELADLVDYNNGLFEAISAWEREHEILRLLYEYVRCNETSRTKEKAVEILKSAGYFQKREQEILCELGYGRAT